MLPLERDHLMGSILYNALLAPVGLLPSSHPVHTGATLISLNSTMLMEDAGSFRMSVRFYQTILHHIAEGSNY